jgi:hypothetical protein
LYRKIIESYVEAYNRFDVAGMLLSADPAIAFENISNGKVTLRTNGLDELRKQAEESKGYFIERKQVIKEMKFGDGVVEAIVDFSGILAADLPGGLKAGEKIEVKGRSIFKFRNDRIIGITDLS